MAVAVGVGVDVAVAVGVGEPAGQAPGWERTTLSTLQPTPAVLLSLPMRQRSTMFCPAAADGRFTVVVIKPADTPPHAERPPSGLACVASIVALYPPVTKLPPAVMISVKAPPPMLISSTPPSKKGSSALERVILSEGQLRGRARDGDGWRVEPLVADHSRIVHKRSIRQ